MNNIRKFGEKNKQTWFVNGLNVLIECASWNSPSILLRSMSEHSLAFNQNSSQFAHLALALIFLFFWLAQRF